jgi:hypothetical protein
MRRTLVALAVAMGLVVVPAAAAQAAPAPTAQVQTAKVQTAKTVKATKYKNCTAMHKKYAGGVAKSSKVRNTKTVAGHKVRAKSSHKPKVSAALYAANKGLDRDKDGIACEK